MSTSASPPPLPALPRLVLRAGFAGRRELSQDEVERLEGSLGLVLHWIGRRLAAITPGIPVERGSEPRIAAFYRPECPLLRLVTGLCEGADAIAAGVLERVRVHPDPGCTDGEATRCLETELAAVIPFDAETYRWSRPEQYREEYDRLLARCAYVLALDGIYEKPSPDTPTAKNRRARAYRAQSAFLLRHSDLLVAAANPNDPGRAGGTMETVRAALAFELPVVFLHTGSGAVYPIDPEEDLDSILAGSPPSEAEWKETIERWVRRLTVDPDPIASPGSEELRESEKKSLELLREYFESSDTPPLENNDGDRRFSFREKAWDRFERFCRAGAKPVSDPPLQPYRTYRSRATNLNYHYSGLYRGAFLLNYMLAIVAVALAAASLVLLSISAHTGPAEEVAALAETAGIHAAPNAGDASTPGWLLPTLLAFAVVKATLLINIARNTRRANKEEWNDRAVDYRYLAERLRGMFYLPRAGSHQPPMAAPPQFASRVVRQSAVDWLFDALVRSISPAETKLTRSVEIPRHVGHGTVQIRELLTVDSRQTTNLVQESWIVEQGQYHNRNARTMGCIKDRIEKTGLLLSRLVIGIVAMDLVLVVLHMLQLFGPNIARKVDIATPWLIFISAVLPAIVAAMNGISFQSECQRLAERSRVMRAMLIGRPPASPPARTGFWGWVRDRADRFAAFARALYQCVTGRVLDTRRVEPSGGRYQLAKDLGQRIALAKSDPSTDPGSWSHDTLRLTERVATDFVQEAAEWSVLYAKELSDPG